METTFTEPQRCCPLHPVLPPRHPVATCMPPVTGMAFDFLGPEQVWSKATVTDLDAVYLFLDLCARILIALSNVQT